jgi:hypothetical protein
MHNHTYHVRTFPLTPVQTGLCDINLAAVDIAAPTVLLSAQVRPPKRRFAELGDSEEEEADSDEVYGWVGDDEVAAEGLLVEKVVSAEDLGTQDAPTLAASRTDLVPGAEIKQVSQKRTATA